MSDEEFVHKMSIEYSNPILEKMWKSSPASVRAILPVTRNDVKAFSDYRLPTDAEPLRAPIVTAVGSSDRKSNNEQSVRAWQYCTSHPIFVFRLFSGGHFFYSENYDEFMPWMWAQVVQFL